LEQTPFHLGDKAKAGGFRLVVHEEIGSTNDEAMRLARDGDPGRIWVVARAQTKGRGRHGRQWQSPAGNLHASLMLIDEIAPRIAPQLGFVAGVALAYALRECLIDDKTSDNDTRVRLKWPNDILCNGAKLAGILLESTSLPGGRFACIMGIGVNCARRPSDLAYEAIALADIGAPQRLPQHVLAHLSDQLATQLGVFDRGRGFAAIRKDWLGLAASLGAPIRVALPKETVHGIFHGIDEAGRLLLDCGGALRVIEAGDVWIGAAVNGLKS
jgi:BirA family biotin operon repressor/biotin-[acetyl-CoA-carboxylase] ligase